MNCLLIHHTSDRNQHSQQHQNCDRTQSHHTAIALNITNNIKTAIAPNLK